MSLDPLDRMRWPGWQRRPRVLASFQLWPAPQAESPLDVFGWLFEHGVEPSRCRVYRGPDGLWRGSGVEVVR